MKTLMKVVPLGLLSLGGVLLLLATTGPRDISAIAYVGLWVGSIAAIALSGILHSKLRNEG